MLLFYKVFTGTLYDFIAGDFDPKHIESRYSGDSHQKFWQSNFSRSIDYGVLSWYGTRECFKWESRAATPTIVCMSLHRRNISRSALACDNGSVRPARAHAAAPPLTSTQEIRSNNLFTLAGFDVKVHEFMNQLLRSIWTNEWNVAPKLMVALLLFCDPLNGACVKLLSLCVSGRTSR